MSPIRPRFSWVPIILHFLVAYALSWLFQTNHDLSAAIVRLAEAMSLIVPSIAGYSAMASNPSWAASYLLISWLGTPFYFWFCWRLSESVLPTWVVAQNASRFWIVCMINSIGAVALLTLPLKHTRISDTTESVRSAAIVASLMKENSVVFAAVTLTVVCVFSFVLAATLKAIQLRLSSNISDRLEGGSDK